MTTIVMTWAHEACVRLTKFAHVMEHFAVCVYSTCEVLGLHAMIWYVSLSLIFIGLLGFVYELIRVRMES